MRISQSAVLLCIGHVPKDLAKFLLIRIVHPWLLAVYRLGKMVESDRDFLCLCNDVAVVWLDTDVLPASRTETRVGCQDFMIKSLLNHRRPQALEFLLGDLPCARKQSHLLVRLTDNKSTLAPPRITNLRLLGGFGD
jgi:hypothetical protein